MLSYSGLQWQNDAKSVASEEHLQIIRQGVAAWNDWRKKNPELMPDLSDADLRDLDFAGLRGANLSWANLSWANLNNCSVSGLTNWRYSLKAGIAFGPSYGLGEDIDFSCRLSLLFPD